MTIHIGSISKIILVDVKHVVLFNVMFHLLKEKQFRYYAKIN
jgi:hypothetical protein